jgi:hypothetical protein
MEFSVPMALVDFVPVILFAWAAIILQRELYHEMSKGAFALFATGTIDIICAGFAKALYKLLYATKVCDFKALNNMFFPVQSLGFLLAGLGVLAMVFFNQKKDALLSAGVPVLSGTMLFVSLMVSGLLIMYLGLGVYAKRQKKPYIIILLFISFICMLGMGYLSSRDCSNAMINWIAEGTNIAGQITLLLSAKLLKK